MRKIIGVVVALLLCGFGAALIWSGFHQPPEEAPQAPAPITAPANQQPAGPTEATVDVFPEEEKGDPKQEMMSPNEMAPNRLYIPSLGVYAKIDQNTGHLQGGTLTLPQANKVTRWQEGSNVTSKEGNILLAGHVSWNGVRGAVYPLAYIKAGARAYITDSEGNREDFQLKELETIVKADLPKDIWETTGAKQLVVVTCGGKIYRRSNGSMHFDSNVIARFVPVAPEVTTTTSPSPTSSPSTTP